MISSLFYRYSVLFINTHLFCINFCTIDWCVGNSMWAFSCHTVRCKRTKKLRLMSIHVKVLQKSYKYAVQQAEVLTTVN